jgi:branched-chain amino acid transport system permease protein
MDWPRVLQLLFAGLIIGGIYALIAVGLNLIYGTMRLLNIAHGELIMLGAYITFWLYTLYGVSPLISMVIVLVCSAVIGLISIIFSNLASLLWTADIQGYSYMTKVITVAGVPLMYNRLLAFGVSLIVCLVCYFLIQKTMLGKAIRALIQDREASQIVGINTNFIYYVSFCIAFAMAGLAGCLLSMFYEITPFMGMPYTIIAFIVIVLGGLGNIFGSLLGGFLLGLFETIGVSITSPGLRPILSYSLFILVILIRPEGIFSRKGRV